MNEPESKLTFNTVEIQEYQRNRPPMLFIDYITECVPMKYAKGIKLFSCTEWYFAGHYPDAPIVPETVLVESLTQVFLMTFLTLDEVKGSATASNRFQNVKFERKVYPGDKLDITAELKSFRRGIAQGRAEGYVNGELAVSFDCTIVVPGVFAEFQRGKAETEKFIESKTVPETGTCYGNTEIKEIINDRSPWLYIDKVIDVKPAESAVGVKNFTYNEWFFPIHFPEEPNVPGFIQLETCIETFLATILSSERYRSSELLIISIDNAKFQRKVLPGECFEARTQIKGLTDEAVSGSVESYVNGEPACSIEITAAVRNIE